MFEWKKLCSRKNIGLVSVLLIVNLLFLILLTYGMEQSEVVPPRSYKAVFRMMKGMDNEEKSDYLNRLEEQSVHITSIAEYKRAKMIEDMAEDAEKIAGYEEYLSRMEEELDEKSVLNLLSKDSEYDERNARKKKEVYQSLHGTKVSYEASEGIMVTDISFTNIVMVFLMILLAIECIIQEKEEGILPVLRCCKKGRGRLISQKIGCLAVVSVTLSGIFFVENLIFGALAYGIGNVLRPVQSLPGYETASVKISVLVFLILVWLIRSLALFLIGLFAFGIAIWTYQVGVVFIGCLVAGGVSGWLFWTTEIQSARVFFYYVNPTALLKVFPLLKAEVNLNLFGYPVSSYGVAIPAWILVCLILAGGITALFIRTRDEIRIRTSRRVVQRRKKCIKSLGGEESYKLWRMRRGFLLLAMVFAIQIALYPKDFLALPEEIYEDGYLSYLGQEVTKEKKEWLDEEWKRLNMDLSSYDSQDKKAVLENRIYPLYARLSEKKEKGEAAEFIRQSGYRKLFGVEELASERKNIMLYILLLILVCSMYITMEKTNGMMTLIKTSKCGFEDVQRAKYKQALVFSTISMIIVWGPDIVWFLRYYGLAEWNKPISWILEFSSWNSHMRIWMYLALLWGIRFASGALLCGLILLVSEKSKTTMGSLAVNMFVFAVPAVLAVLGIPGTMQYTFNVFLEGNSILCSGDWIVLYGIIFLSIGIMVFSMRKKMERKN